MNSDDDELKIPLGRIGNRGQCESFVNQVLRAMRKAGHAGSAAGSGGPRGTADRRSGAAGPRSAAAGSLPLTAVSW
jgi:hypothetical protein